MKNVINQINTAKKTISKLIYATYKSFKELTQSQRDFKKIIFNIYISTKTKLNNLYKTNLSLGLHHMHNHNLRDAILRFKITSILCKKTSKVLQLQYARTNIRKNKKQKAIALLSSITSNVETKGFLLDQLYNGKKFQHSPENLRKERFIYMTENSLIRYRYKFQELTENAAKLTKLIIHNATNLSKTIEILDLGCIAGDYAANIEETIYNAHLTALEINANILNDKAKSMCTESTSFIFLPINDASLKVEQHKFDIIFAEDWVQEYRSLSDLVIKFANSLKKETYIIAWIFKEETDKENEKIFNGYEIFTHNENEMTEDMAKINFLQTSQNLCNELKNNKFKFLVFKNNALE